MKNRNRTRHLALVLGACVLVSSLQPTLASGSYRSRTPNPPAKQKDLDRAKYSFGMRVFVEKKVKFDAQGDADAQRDRLQALQHRLPERVAKKKDLPSLAGKLTVEQLDALEYYVNHRYGK